MLSKHHKLLTDKVEMSGGLTTFTDWLSEAEGKAMTPAESLPLMSGF